MNSELFINTLYIQLRRNSYIVRLNKFLSKRRQKIKELTLKNLLLIIVLACISTFSIAGDKLSAAQLKQKAEAFLNAKNARQQPDTTVDDINNYISLLADKFIDEHIKYNVTITSKDELRKSMIAKMKDKVSFSEINIDQLMYGIDVVFVKYTEHAKVKPAHLDKVIEYTVTNILSLEFDEDGLIKHIRRHHGF